jgi:hypothetical protein
VWLLGERLSDTAVVMNRHGHPYIQAINCVDNILHFISLIWNNIALSLIVSAALYQTTQ